MMKLGGLVHRTKISPEFEFGGHRPHPWVPTSQMCQLNVRDAESLHKKSTHVGVAVGHATTSVSK